MLLGMSLGLGLGDAVAAPHTERRRRRKTRRAIGAVGAIGGVAGVAKGRIFGK